MADKDPGYSPFVQAVAGDGTSPPDVRVLTGWLGASGEEGYVRLYLDATLSAYVDIPRDAVLYSEEIPNSHPAGQRTVWVRSEAELKEGGSAISRAAKFLFGQVQQDFLGGGGGGAQGAQVQAPQTQICLTFKPGCQPSVANPCITRTEMPNCRFTRIPCSAIDACPSALIECNQPTSPPCATASPCTCPGPVTVKWPDCGSAVDACPTRICIPQTETGPQCFGDVQAQAQVGAPNFDFNLNLWRESAVCLRTIVNCRTSLAVECLRTFNPNDCRTEHKVFCPTWVKFGCTVPPPGGMAFEPQARQQVGGPGFPTMFCTPPPPSVVVACPTPTVLGCPTAGFCPPRTIGCPVPSAFCPTRFNCPFPSQFQCPSFGRCPSAVDACPSSLGCTFACGFDFQQTPVQQQQPQFDAQQFGQQQVGAPIGSALCMSQGFPCPTPSVFCPQPFTVPRTICWTGARPMPSQFCPTFGHCPSAVDACPSSLGCTFACGFDQTIAQQPQLDQQFAHQQVGGPGFPIMGTWICPPLSVWPRCTPSMVFGRCPFDWQQTPVAQQPQFDANVFGGGGAQFGAPPVVVNPPHLGSRFCPASVFCSFHCPSVPWQSCRTNFACGVQF